MGKVDGWLKKRTAASHRADILREKSVLIFVSLTKDNKICQKSDIGLVTAARYVCFLNWSSVKLIQQRSTLSTLNVKKILAVINATYIYCFFISQFKYMNFIYS